VLVVDSAVTSVCFDDEGKSCLDDQPVLTTAILLRRRLATFEFLTQLVSLSPLSADKRRQQTTSELSHLAIPVDELSSSSTSLLTSQKFISAQLKDSFNQYPLSVVAMGSLLQHMGLFGNREQYGSFRIEAGN
jgi:hypothetical protein